jgi:hypothetical protein
LIYYTYLQLTYQQTGLPKTCFIRNSSISGYYLIFTIFVNKLKRLSKLRIIFVYNFIYSRNRIYNIYIYFYSNNLSELLFHLFHKNKASGNFYKTINRSYYFLRANLTLVTSYTTFIVLIITRIITSTSINRRLIIRLRLILEFF